MIRLPPASRALSLSLPDPGVDAAGFMLASAPRTLRIKVLLAGAPLCAIEPLGLVISGRAMAAMQDGREIELNPGELFHIPAVPHDSWVIGEEPYISLHFLGADSYTK